MRFEWDPKKNESNIKKHGIDFAEAETVFEDENSIVMYDDANSDYEDRFKIVGFSRKLRELTVCFCLRDNDEITRIISARRIRKGELKFFRGGYDYD